MNNIKRRFFALVEPVSYADTTKNQFDWFDIFIVILIVLNIIAIILSSIDSIDKSLSKPFNYFEIFSIVVFSIEYLIRLWTCTENPRYKDPFWGRIRFIFSPLLTGLTPINGAEIF